jgi:hypothetical protein
MVTKLIKKLAAIAFVLGLAQVPAQGAITYFVGPGTNEIPALTGFATTGALMSGLAVTADFTSFSETLIWATTGVGSGGVSSASGWGLSLTGDTFTVPWNFTIAAGVNLGQLNRLTLDGLGAFTVFDRTLPSFGTDGSAQGNDFECTAVSAAVCDDHEVSVTYDFQVNLAGDPAVGDLWQTVVIEFRDPATEELSGPRESWSFLQDTDNDSRRFQVPEPGSLLLLGLALGAAGLISRRRKITR